MTDEPPTVKPPRSTWTALKDEVLARMWPDPTIPTDVIAKELDVTEAAAAMRPTRRRARRPPSDRRPGPRPPFHLPAPPPQAGRHRAIQVRHPPRQREPPPRRPRGA